METDLAISSEMLREQSASNQTQFAKLKENRQEAEALDHQVSKQ